MRMHSPTFKDFKLKKKYLLLFILKYFSFLTKVILNFFITYNSSYFVERESSFWFSKPMFPLIWRLPEKMCLSSIVFLYTTIFIWCVTFGLQNKDWLVTANRTDNHDGLLLLALLFKINENGFKYYAQFKAI